MIVEADTRPSLQSSKQAAGGSWAEVMTLLAMRQGKMHEKHWRKMSWCWYTKDAMILQSMHIYISPVLDTLILNLNGCEGFRNGFPNLSNWDVPGDVPQLPIMLLESHEQLQNFGRSQRWTLPMRPHVIPLGVLQGFWTLTQHQEHQRFHSLHSLSASRFARFWMHPLR